MGTALRAVHKPDEEEHSPGGGARRKQPGRPRRSRKRPPFRIDFLSSEPSLEQDPILRPLIEPEHALLDNLADVLYIIDEECHGPECEEDCPIPEEYKIMSETEAIDVMAFLGISRATPLRAREGMESAWE